MPDRVPEHVSPADLDRERRLFATVGEVACILPWDPWSSFISARQPSGRAARSAAVWLIPAGGEHNQTFTDGNEQGARQLA